MPLTTCLPATPEAADMDWGTAGAETLFEDIDGRSFLPAKLAARVVDWVRPRDFIATKKGKMPLSAKTPS